MEACKKHWQTLNIQFACHRMRGRLLTKRVPIELSISSHLNFHLLALMMLRAVLVACFCAGATGWTLPSHGVAPVGRAAAVARGAPRTSASLVADDPPLMPPPRNSDWRQPAAAGELTARRLAELLG